MKKKSEKNTIVYARKRRTDDVFVATKISLATEVSFSPVSSRRADVLVLVVTALFVASVWGAGSTAAYFNDGEESSLNRFSAGLLAFTVSPENSSVYVGEEEGGEATLMPVMTPQTGSFDIAYRVSAEKISGDDAFCNALQLSATSSPFVYNGALLSLSTGTSTVGLWQTRISLPQNTPGISEGNICSVDLVYNGWRDGAAEGMGYTDSRRVHLSLHARMVVINEFLPNPEGEAYGFDFGTDSDDMPRGEWVELYNNGDTDFDLAGYYIWDASGSAGNKVVIMNANTNTGGTTIAAHGFLVVYLNKAILNNSDDEVRLYTGGDELTDVYSYAGHDACTLEPTPGDANETTTGSGSCSTIPPNKSYARIPDGLGAWVDPIPTPGFSNTLNDSEAVYELSQALGSESDQTQVASGAEEVSEVVVPPEIVADENVTTLSEIDDPVTPSVLDESGEDTPDPLSVETNSEESALEKPDELISTSENSNENIVEEESIASEAPSFDEPVVVPAEISPAENTATEISSNDSPAADIPPISEAPPEPETQ